MEEAQTTAAQVTAWIRFAFTAPWALVGWLWVVVMCFVVWAADFKKLRFEGAGILTAEWRPWAARFWPFSTTIGRGIIFFPGARDASDEMDERLERHERIHIWQVEDLMLLSFIIGLVVSFCTGDFLLGFFLWWSGGLWQLPNFATALLRFGHTLRWPTEGKWHEKLAGFLKDLFLGVAYRDSEHERSAYAQTSLWPNGQSWFEAREGQRK
tara:strand:+ start:222580 stop:223212 length:633 start_codon:yes stop_codon:yes gene_type:complete